MTAQTPSIDPHAASNAAAESVRGLGLSDLDLLRTATILLCDLRERSQDTAFALLQGAIASCGTVQVLLDN